MSVVKIITEGRPGAIVNVPLIEWTDILSKAVPPKDNPTQLRMLTELRMGAKNAEAHEIVGILADQGKMVLDMLPKEPARKDSMEGDGSEDQTAADQ